MSAPERLRLEGLADDVKERALELRGTPDPDRAGRDLGQASERLADAMVQSADADPEVSDSEVEQLRGDLARELERLATAEVTASRVGHEQEPRGSLHSSSSLPSSEPDHNR